MGCRLSSHDESVNTLLADKYSIYGFDECQEQLFVFNQLDRQYAGGTAAAGAAAAPPTSSSGGCVMASTMVDDGGGNHLLNDDTSRRPCKQNNRRLLKWHDMPAHLQFNPYIHTGYRPMLTFWQSLHSLTYLHNETINIITHGIPIVYILIVVPRVIPWDKIESHFLAWCHFAGSISPWIGSFLYHLFMNMNMNGSKFYYRLLQLDMLGIWVTQSFGALPMVSASIYCLHPILQWFSIACYAAFSVFGLYKAMMASSPWNRRLCFTLPFLMRNLLCLLRLTRWGGGDPTAMSTVILQDLVSVIGGAIGAMNIPERWFPGSLDYYLNSHNIMHILVVLAVYFMHLSTMKDLVWMSQGTCPNGEPTSTANSFT